MNDIPNIISTLGFPIASYLISAWFIKYTYDRQMKREESHDKQASEHWQQLYTLTNAVNENTQTLRELVKALNE